MKAYEGPLWDAYRAWVAHVHPSEASGKAPCWECVRAEAPSAGCADGIELYGAYRLAKVERRAASAG